MNKYQKLASNTIILAIGQFGSKLLVYFMLKYYTSMLGADGFGDVNNIINASSLLISVVTLSINEGVLRFALDRSNNGKHVLSIGLNTAIIGLLLFAAAVPLIGFIDMLAEYRWLIYMYVATGSIKGICAIYVRARGHVKLFAADGIITTITVILLNLLFLGIFNLGVVGYVLSVSLGDFCSIIFLSLTAKLYKQYRPLGNDQVLAKSMIRYSIPLMPTTIMWWIINVSDTFMVTAFFGSAANGVYSFAFKFPNLAAIVVGIFSQAWHMSAITERNSRKISQFYSNVFSMIETVMFIAASGILLILRPLIMPFFGSEEFAGAYIYVPFLVAAVVFQSFNNFLSSIYEASQKTMHSLISSIIGASSNVLLNLILLHSPMGVLGAALATFISYVLVYIYRVIDTRKYLYMSVNFPMMFLNLGLLGVMSACVMLMDEGLILNVVNSVVFLLIVAINFKSAVRAVKLFISRKTGKGSAEE